MNDEDTSLANTATEREAEHFYEGCRLARVATANAIEDIDSLLGEDDCALKYPQLITGYVAFVGAIYAARIRQEAPAISH